MKSIVHSILGYDRAPASHRAESVLLEGDFPHQWEAIIRAFEEMRKHAAGDADAKIFTYMREACSHLRDGQVNGVLQASRYLKGASDAAAKLAKDIAGER